MTVGSVRVPVGPVRVSVGTDPLRLPVLFDVLPVIIIFCVSEDFKGIWYSAFFKVFIWLFFSNSLNVLVSLSKASEMKPDNFVVISSNFSFDLSDKCSAGTDHIDISMFSIFSVSSDMIVGFLESCVVRTSVNSVPGFKLDVRILVLSFVNLVSPMRKDKVFAIDVFFGQHL